MAHIGQPFHDQQAVDPVDIFREMSIIRCREVGELIACRKLLRLVKHGLEEGGEPFVFDDLGVLKEREQETIMRRRNRLSSGRLRVLLSMTVLCALSDVNARPKSSYEHLSEISSADRTCSAIGSCRRNTGAGGFPFRRKRRRRSC